MSYLGGGGGEVIYFCVNVEELGACLHPSGLETWNKSPSNLQTAVPGCELLPGTAQRASLRHLAAAKTSARRVPWKGEKAGAVPGVELWVRPLWQSRRCLASSLGLQDAPLEQGQWSVASPLSISGGNAVHWMIQSTPMACLGGFVFIAVPASDLPGFCLVLAVLWCLGPVSILRCCAGAGGVPAPVVRLLPKHTASPRVKPCSVSWPVLTAREVFHLAGAVLAPLSAWPGTEQEAEQTLTQLPLPTERVIVSWSVLGFVWQDLF